MVVGVVSPIPGKHSQATAPQIALTCTVSLVGRLMQQSWKMLEVYYMQDGPPSYKLVYKP